MVANESNGTPSFFNDELEKSIQEKKERDSFRSMLNSESKEKVIERKQEVQSVKKGRSR